jgi:hypothetical protein
MADEGLASIEMELNSSKKGIKVVKNSSMLKDSNKSAIP